MKGSWIPMPRLRVLLAILVLLTGTVLAAGCAGTDAQGAGSQGATTVTVPPTTVPPTTATTPPPSTMPTATPGPTLVWPYTTAVNVIHSVKVPPVPLLDHVRVGRHAGYDRIVFEFAGPIPAYRVQPVAALFEDASGAPVWPGQRNLLQIRLEPAQAHTNAGRSTLTPGEERAAPGLPALRQFRLIGDFEGVVTYGLRLGLGTPNLRVSELTSPNRLVIDLAHQRLARVKVWFLHVPNYSAGRQPELVTALRAITPARVAQGALDAIFAGPTPGERARGLGTVRSGATGATVLRISGGVAHVRLRGAPASHGATVTVATLIMPTLKQVPSIDYVKLYDPSGHTQFPTGRRDSIPASLEP
jgi:hypothetical protein